MLMVMRVLAGCIRSELLDIHTRCSSNVRHRSYIYGYIALSNSTVILDTLVHFDDVSVFSENTGRSCFGWSGQAVLSTRCLLRSTVFPINDASDFVGVQATLVPLYTPTYARSLLAFMPRNRNALSRNDILLTSDACVAFNVLHNADLANFCDQSHLSFNSMDGAFATSGDNFTLNLLDDRRLRLDDGINVPSIYTPGYTNDSFFVNGSLGLFASAYSSTIFFRELQWLIRDDLAEGTNKVDT